MKLIPSATYLPDFSTNLLPHAGGLATLVEKKSRRMELAIYCASRALESFALCLVEWGFVRKRDVPKRIDVLMFSAAAAAIMHCYSDGRGRHRDVFRSKYLNVLDFVFGNTGAGIGLTQSLDSACPYRKSN